MKNTTKILLIIIAGICLTWACKKIEVGYLSDHIHYGNPLVYVTKGAAFVTPALMPDGSTKPLSVEMTEIRHKESGQVATDLMQERPLTTWKERFNPGEDLTMADVMAKIEVMDVPAFEVNTTSGQVRFNENTRYATGVNYEYDLKISNVRGAKMYPGIGQIVMANVPPVRYRTTTRIQVVAMDPHQVIYSEFENMARHLDGTSTMHTVTKLSNQSASGTGVTVILKIKDKNGKPFSAAAGHFQAGWPGYDLAGYEYASVDTEKTNEGWIYHFPALPFPFANYASQAYTYWHVTNEAIGAVDLPNFDPARRHWLNIRLNMDILEEGTWEIVVNFPMVTHK